MRRSPRTRAAVAHFPYRVAQTASVVSTRPVRFVCLGSLAVLDVRDDAVGIEVHVEPVLVEVTGDHLAGLDDAAVFGEICLAEGLKPLLAGIAHKHTLSLKLKQGQ